MASVLDLVKHYQHAIEKYPQDEQKILKCIDKLYQLGVTVQHLQETGVGRTVNALRKEPGDVGQAARALVYKWKLMVASEESDQEGDHNNETSKYNGNGKDSDDNVNQTRSECSGQENETSYKSPSKPDHNDYKHMNGNHDGTKRKYQSSEDEASSAKKSRHSSSSEEDCHRKSDVKIRKESSDSETDNQDTENSQSDSDASYTSEEETKVKIKTEPMDKHHKSPPSKDSLYNRVDHDRKSSDSRKSSEKHFKHRSESKHSSEKSPSKDRSHSSHNHKNSKEKVDSSKKRHKSEKESKHKEELSSSSKHKSDSEKNKSSLQNPDSGSEKLKSKSKSDKHDSKSEKRSSSQTHKMETDKHKKTSGKEISSDKHKSKDNSSSLKEKHSSSKEKSKDNSGSLKEKHSSSKDKSKDRSSSKEKCKEKLSDSHSKGDKKHSSSKDKSKDSDKKSKHKKYNESGEKTSKRSSSSSHKSSSSSSNKSKEPKKKHVNSIEDGIDCGSGASFAEALGMIAPSKPKKKSSGIKDTSSPNNSFTNDLSPAALLAPSAKLAPLPALEISALPEISPNYKPRPPPKLMPHFSDEDAISVVMSSKNQRTKVYSGNKVLGKIPSLYEMCVQILQEHIDALEYTGGVPYEILKPVVDKATPQQLFVLEHFNPYLMEDTDHLWQKSCEKHFRNKQRQELESWREMYIRCQEEQEHKLKSLTANIRIAQEAKKAPIKQTKMAYVDSVVKPPRNIARKQAQHGTAHAAAASPAARVAALASAPNVLRGSARPSLVVPTAINKPKKAPLMQKALQFMRGRKR